MEDTLVFDGGSVKALGNGRVGGHLIIFSSQKDPDLSRDYFNRETDYDIEDETKSVRVLYWHGMDTQVKARKLGRGVIRVDDVGVWIEAQLGLRDEYERAIYKLAEAGKLGWSSGSAPHLVQREAQGKSFYIKSWPIIEASLTPQPVEPRTSAVALKSLATEHVEFDDMVKSLKEDEERPLSLEGLPALSKVVAPTDLKGLAERSESTEAAVEEFLTHGQIVSEVLKSHLARVENNAEFRFVKDGRQISAANKQRIETMRSKLGRMITEYKSVDAGLERLQKMSEAVKAQADGMNEQARFELWNFLRISGTTPEELHNEHGIKHMGEARI